MKVSVIQMNMKADAVEYNFTHTRELLIKAAQTSPDVIILPETWNTGFFPKENINELSDRNGQRTKELLESISRKYNVYIIGGSVSEEKDGNIYNTSYIYDREGKNIASYSKTHLFSPMDEHIYYKAGDSFCLFSIDGVKAAVMICYDLRFPEIARKLALSGAEVLFIPAQWPYERISQMEILLKARAVENQMFAVLCNSAGTFEATVFGGTSLASDPYGNLLFKGTREEEILFCDIDTDTLSSVRESINVFNDRRHTLY